MKTFFCPFCGKKTGYVKTTGRLPGGFSYFRCMECEGGILYPKPGKIKTEKIYVNQNYFDSLARPVRNPILQWLLTRRIYETPIEWITKKFKQKGKVLDVGCGNGEFLEGMKNEGWEVYGSDISSEAVRRTKNRVEKKGILTGKFTSQNFGVKLDLVCFWHILEHTEDAKLYLDKANKTLKKGGYVTGEVPNYDSFVFRIFRENYVWIMIPDHILYFSKRSLRKVLKDGGFKKIKIYLPPRALLNFSLSFHNYLIKRGISKIVSKPIVVLSIPLSILIGVFSSTFGMGEVIRFIAKK